MNPSPSNIAESTRLIRIAHSPDADDRFMFWPLRTGKVSLPGYAFTFVEADTQTLNIMAETERPEVCAISAVHYGRVWEWYQPLRMGCSVGNNYGPVLVVTRERAAALGPESQRDPIPQVRLSGVHLLSPGSKTTAQSVLTELGYLFASCEDVPIVPIERVFERLHDCEASGQPTAALLIHEGRLIFEDFGCVRVLDLGRAWMTRTGGSLPLGMNVISRAMPEADRRALAALFVASCRYAQAHREEFVAEAGRAGSPFQTPLSAQALREYLDLYANDTTTEVSPADQVSFETLLKSAAIPGTPAGTSKPVVDWI